MATGMESAAVSSFETLALARYPRDAMFAATRDALPYAVAEVEEIERVIVRRRVDLGGGAIELENLWQASIPIPQLLRHVIQPEMLVWTDHSVWTLADYTCRWRIVSHYFPDNLHCSGFTRYEEAA